MAVVSKIITEKQDNPWNGERPGQDTKKWKKNIITYQIISKRASCRDNTLYCSCSITPAHHPRSSLLKSTHAIPYHLRWDTCWPAQARPTIMLWISLVLHVHCERATCIRLCGARSGSPIIIHNILRHWVIVYEGLSPQLLEWAEMNGSGNPIQVLNACYFEVAYLYK